MESTSEIHSPGTQAHQETDTKSQDYRTLLPVSHPYIAEGLFTAFPSNTSYPPFDKKLQVNTKYQKTQRKKTEQGSEPEMAEMEEMLELSDQEILKTIISMLRIFMENVENM